MKMLVGENPLQELARALEDASRKFIKIHAPHDASLQVAAQEADEACLNLRQTEAKAEDMFL